MSTLPIVHSYLEWSQVHDSEGRHVKVINTLAKKNALFRTMLARETNMPNGHRSMSYDGLPDAVWRRIGQGLSGSRATASPAFFNTGELATRASIDKTLMDISANPQDERLSRSMAFMETIIQGFSSQMFYGSPDPDKPAGLAYYYAALSGSAASRNVVSAGGAANDQTSAFLVNWGEGQVFAGYPRNSKAGIEHIDVGDGKPVLVDDGSGTGKQLLAYVDDWYLRAALCMEDWRHAGRVCNIDITDLKTNVSGTHERLMGAMTDLHYQIPDIGPNAAWYVSRFTAAQLHKAAVDRVRNGSLSIQEVGGRPVTHFIGVPVYADDNILVNETVVS